MAKSAKDIRAEIEAKKQKAKELLEAAAAYEKELVALERAAVERQAQGVGLAVLELHGKGKLTIEAVLAAIGKAQAADGKAARKPRGAK